MIQLKAYQKEENIKLQLLEVLKTVDQDFYPPLSTRKPLSFWLNLFEKGVILYIEKNQQVAGFLAYYPSMSGSILDELRACVNVDPILVPRNGNVKYEEAYLHFIAIHPEYRGLNLGSKLMTNLLSDALSRGVTKMRVITWSTNVGSINLYKKHGFEIFNAIPNDRGNNVGSVYLETKIINSVECDSNINLISFGVI